MVDALNEAWRVLVPERDLIDLRPLSGTYSIAIVSPGTEVCAGDVDANAAAADDAAADRAVRQVVENGWFEPRRRLEFDFDFYWDTVTEMASHIAASRRLKRVRPSYAEIEKFYRDVSAGSAGPVRLRCRRRMVLAAYRKTT